MQPLVQSKMSLWFLVPFRVGVVYGGYAMFDHFYDDERRYKKARQRAIEQLLTEALEKKDKKIY